MRKLNARPAKRPEGVAAGKVGEAPKHAEGGRWSGHEVPA